MRFLCFCAFFITSVFVISCYDLYEGQHFGARMTYRQVKKHGLLFFKRKEIVDLEYPVGTNITGIAIIDLDPEKSGTVSILAGGLYYNFVYIILESARSVGLRYTIEIYQ